MINVSALLSFPVENGQALEKLLAEPALSLRKAKSAFKLLMLFVAWR